MLLGAGSVPTVLPQTGAGVKRAARRGAAEADRAFARCCGSTTTGSGREMNGESEVRTWKSSES